jgi:3',5'-cyclic AMP phosphodiesterase CpdA
MRIVHLSDLHASTKGDRDQDEIVKAVLEDVSARDAEQRIDIAVFSGDLAFDGTAEGFARGRELLLDPLAERLPGRPIVLVPGNHDVNLGRINGIFEAGLQQTLRDRETVAALQTSAAEVAQATDRLSDWEDFDAAWDGNVRAAAADPLAKTVTLSVGDATVGVALINTAWRARGGEGDHQRLLVGEPQLAAALAAIDSADVRIVVMHHPLDWLADFDAQAVRAQLEGAGVFVLTGHEHSADPVLEISTRGAALYSKAGCLYSGHSYSNSYTLLDLDMRLEGAVITVRRWWPGKRSFDQATDLHSNGVVELQWPKRANALPAQRAALPEVVSPLAEIAREQSVLAAAEELEHPTVSDLLIPPRLWPVPHKDAIDATVPPEDRPSTVDAIEVLENNRVLLVSGGAISGVTSTLLWLVERHFRRTGTHIPAYVRIDSRISLGRLNQAIASARAQIGERPDSGTPVILAIDDAAPQDSRALARLLRFVDEHPEVIVVIGTHGEAQRPIAEMFKEREIPYERVFLGPFGRRELRQLVARMVGPQATDLVQRVLRTIHRQRLPRNPLNIAALVSVLTREPDLTTINESGLLQSYVNILLENPTGVDPEGLSMDYRRREHILERLANHLVRANVTRLPRAEIERFVLDYFEEVGWRSGSAGHLVDSLIRRRVLNEDERGVGFRYPALLYLFAAKWMLENEDFAEFVLADPIAYSQIIRHVAGLRRNATELLETVGRVAASALDQNDSGLTVKQFELMKDQHGWSQVNDLDHVRALLEPPPEQPSEEELDEIYEETAENPPEDVQLELVGPKQRSLSTLDEIEASVRLLGAVLQSSELVPDIELKADALRKVIRGWSISTVVLAVHEDETGFLRDLFEQFVSETDEDLRRSLAEHLARVIVVTFMSFLLYVDTGSIHLEAVLERILDDPEFMSETAPALFATMLYAMLELPGWPERMQALHDKHGRHPMVAELVRGWALQQYKTKEFERTVEGPLESLLADLLMPERGGASSVPERAGQRSRIIEDLRRSRTQARFAQRDRGEISGDDEDVLDLEPSEE